MTKHSPQPTGQINAEKYLIQPIPVEETDNKTLRLPNIITRHLSQALTAQKSPDNLTTDEFELSIACLPFIDDRTGQGVTTVTDIENAFLGIFGVKKNRREIVEDFENIFNKYQEIKAKTIGENGKVFTGHIKFRLLTQLGFLDDKKREITKTKVAERADHKYIKQIYFKYDTHIVEALKSKLEGYTNTKIRFFKQHYKLLNLRQRKLILPLLAEQKDYKDIRKQDLDHIYNFSKYGVQRFNEDIQELKDKGLISNASVMRPYKQYKNSYFAHLVKGDTLKQSVGTTEAPQLALDIAKTESKNLIGEQELIASQELIKKIKHLKDKRKFTLVEILDKLKGCMADLIEANEMTPEEAKDFKIKDKGMLARRLAGERKFTDTEARAFKKLLETY